MVKFENNIVNNTHTLCMIKNRHLIPIKQQPPKNTPLLETFHTKII